MAFRRKRKPRVVWLPPVGNSITQNDDNYVNGPAGTLTLPNDGTIVFDAVPVTFDYSDPASIEQGVFNRSLQDLTSGNNYRLRRIVGKVFVGATPNIAEPTIVGIARVTCGFIINKTDDSGNLTLATIDPQDGAPIAQDAAQDPWIWRRSWTLSPLPRSYASDSLSGVLSVLRGFTQWPQNNCEYGSVQDGPHIDQKTARVVGNQERLVFWISGRMNNDMELGQIDIDWALDLRILASLRLNQGNRRNASR